MELGTPTNSVAVPNAYPVFQLFHGSAGHHYLAFIVFGAILPVIVILIGTAGNILNLVVLRRPAYRNNSNAIVVRMLAIADLLTLWTVVLIFLGAYVFGPDFLIEHPGVCRQYAALTFTSQSIVNWLLVLISCQRYVSIRFIFLARSIFNLVWTRIYILCILTYSVVASQLLILYAQTYVKRLYENQCGLGIVSNGMPLSLRALIAFFQFFFPAVALVVFNILIIVGHNRLEARHQALKKELDELDCGLGYYGWKCEKKCGHCVGGLIFCDSIDGICVNGCSWGYTGNTCHEKCLSGWYGYNCQHACSQNCKDWVCDHRTGACSDQGCIAGYTGDKCTDVCPDDTYGERCGFKCDCPAQCGCDPVNGTCHKSCPEKSEGESRAKRGKGFENFFMPYAAPDDGLQDAPNTQMMCSQLKGKFGDLQDKLNNQVVLPYMALLLCLLVPLLICCGLALWDVMNHANKERHKKNWVKENLDAYLEDEASDQDSGFLAESPAEIRQTGSASGALQSGSALRVEVEEDSPQSLRSSLRSLNEED